MKRERIEARIFYTLKCDYCEEQSPEFEGSELPDGWIEHEVPFDLEAHQKAYGLFNGTGQAGGSTFHHFDSKEHLKLWKEDPSSYVAVYFGTGLGSDET